MRRCLTETSPRRSLDAIQAMFAGCKRRGDGFWRANRDAPEGQGGGRCAGIYRVIPTGVEADSRCVMADTSMPLGGPEVRPEGPAITRAAFVRGHVSVIPRTGITATTDPCPGRFWVSRSGATRRRFLAGSISLGGIASPMRIPPLQSLPIAARLLVRGTDIQSGLLSAASLIIVQIMASISLDFSLINNQSFPRPPHNNKKCVPKMRSDGVRRGAAMVEVRLVRSRTG
jgi:hypothetical protein